MILPEHMTVWDRNKRLYDTLMVWGYTQRFVLCRDDPTKIDQIIVAAGPPSVILQVAEHPAQTGVSAPVQGTHVVDDVKAAQRQGDNVISLPTKI